MVVGSVYPPFALESTNSLAEHSVALQQYVSTIPAPQKELGGRVDAGIAMV
jgi:hypothetical protein